MEKAPLIKAVEEWRARINAERSRREQEALYEQRLKMAVARLHADLAFVQNGLKGSLISGETAAILVAIVNVRALLPLLKVRGR